MSNRIALLLCISAAFLISVECGISLKNIFQHRTTTEEPPTTTEAPLFINVNLPKVDAGCTLHFECKKKLKDAAVPKPCVKYCIKYTECPGGVSFKGKAGECYELNEELVAQKDSESTTPASGGILPKDRVAMIDFPCQPGYLPDSRGRCREVW